MIKLYLDREMKRWQQAMGQVAGGQGGADAVHQLRMRSRRFREGLRLVGCNSRMLSRFNHSLGPPRDVEMLCQRLAEMAEATAGRDRLQKLFARQRLAQRKALAHRLRSASVRHLSQSMQAAAQTISLDEMEEKELTGEGLRKAYHRLRRLWKERPTHVKKHYLHALRRAIRKLRYAAEFLAPLGGKRVRRLAKRAVPWQQLLGDYHDAIIAQRLLRRTRSDEARVLVPQFRISEREIARKFWKKWRRKGWHKLRSQSKKAIKSLH